MKVSGELSLSTELVCLHVRDKTLKCRVIVLKKSRMGEFYQSSKLYSIWSMSFIPSFLDCFYLSSGLLLTLVSNAPKRASNSGIFLGIPYVQA